MHKSATQGTVNSIPAAGHINQLSKNYFLHFGMANKRVIDTILFYGKWKACKYCPH